MSTDSGNISTTGFYKRFYKNIKFFFETQQCLSDQSSPTGTMALMLGFTKGTALLFFDTKFAYKYPTQKYFLCWVPTCRIVAKPKVSYKYSGKGSVGSCRLYC